MIDNPHSGQVAHAWAGRRTMRSKARNRCSMGLAETWELG